MAASAVALTVRDPGEIDEMIASKAPGTDGFHLRLCSDQQPSLSPQDDVKNWKEFEHLPTGTFWWYYSGPYRFGGKWHEFIDPPLYAPYEKPTAWTLLYCPTKLDDVRAWNPPWSYEGPRGQLDDEAAAAAPASRLPAAVKRAAEAEPTY